MNRSQDKTGIFETHTKFWLAGMSQRFHNTVENANQFFFEVPIQFGHIQTAALSLSEAETQSLSNEQHPHLPIHTHTYTHTLFFKFQAGKKNPTSKLHRLLVPIFHISSRNPPFLNRQLKTESQMSKEPGWIKESRNRS